MARGAWVSVQFDRPGARHLCAMVTPLTSMSTRRSGWKQATIWPRGSLEQSLSGHHRHAGAHPFGHDLGGGQPLGDQVALHRLRALAREALVELGRAGRIGVAGDVDAPVVELVELGGELVELGLGGGPKLEAVEREQRVGCERRRLDRRVGAAGARRPAAARASSARGSSTGSGRSGCTCTGSGSITRGARGRRSDGYRLRRGRGTRTSSRCPSGRCPRSRSSRSRRSRWCE